MSGSTSGGAARPTAQLSWAVVGGGMLGLTVAHRLAQQGQQVAVFEAASSLGGLASGWQVGHVAWDRYYHVTLLSDGGTRELLGELGLEDQMRWVETKTGFYTDGALHSMSNSWEFLRFPPLGLIDKLRLGATIFAGSKRKNWKALEGVLVADWLTRWSGRRTFEKIWEPLLLAKLGEAYRKTSAAFIGATIARMYKARQSGLKKEMFGYLPGGYARVIDRYQGLLSEEGVEVSLEQPVTSVVANGDGTTSLSTGDAVQCFDRVVVTTPSSMLPRLCPQLSADERDQHAAVEYLGVICASAVLRRPLANYYVTNITESWTPFTAVIEMTALVDPQEFGGRHLVYLPRYAGPDDESWNWSDQEIEAQFVGALARMYPQFSAEQVEAFRVSRAKHVMALPTLNYSDHLPPMATSVPNVFAVNSAHVVNGTLNVNEIVELANDAVSEVLRPTNPDRQFAGLTRAPSYGEAVSEPIARS